MDEWMNNLMTVWVSQWKSERECIWMTQWMYVNERMNEPVRELMICVLAGVHVGVLDWSCAVCTNLAGAVRSAAQVSTQNGGCSREHKHSQVTLLYYIIIF